MLDDRDDNFLRGLSPEIQDPHQYYLYAIKYKLKQPLLILVLPALLFTIIIQDYYLATICHLVENLSANRTRDRSETARSVYLSTVY